MRNKLRECRFSPYLKGKGPTFVLQIFDAGTINSSGKSCLAYKLILCPKGPLGKGNVLLFDGADFCCSPLYAIDSDDCIKSLMGFLCLKRGDTDSEYFENYTAEQTEFSETHAEYLQMEVYNRFGMED